MAQKPMAHRIDTRLVRRALSLSIPVGVIAFVAVSWGGSWPSSTPMTAQAQSSPAATVARTASKSSIDSWSDAVWAAAKRGDLKAVEEALKAIPDGHANGEVARLRALVADRAAHANESAGDRTKEVEAATKELTDAIAAKNASKALTGAVKLQTLSDNYRDALSNPDVQAAIALGIEADTRAQAEGDWLLSQEVLYRLRTLYEDSGDRDAFKRYADALEKVNRRIGLMAQYAPKRLHELRVSALERLESKEKLPEWNPASAEDWKDGVRGINIAMLKAALKTAANEHISSRGWKPLLAGGLDALAIFATTDALEETFPGLADDAKIKTFVAAVDEARERVAATPAERLGSPDSGEILRDVLEANRASIDLPDSVLLHEFGDGALDELAGKFEDQYSEIIWPERLRRFEQQVNGDFVGVGILIRHDDKRDILVVNPLEGSPAARGGIKADDRIVSVNGMPTTGWSLNKAVDEITGPPGQPVTLSVRRTGKELPFDVSLVRDTIKIRSVNGWWKKGLDQNGAPEWDWWIDKAGGIGYVRLTSFNEDSFDDFRAAIDAMRAERPLNGLVLDLRHNPGGLLKSAVDFTNAFVPTGEVVSGENKTGQRVWSLEAQPNKADLRDLPLVVLVNQGSASASEIVSGALQAHDAAVILGERSFGKGSVQTVHDVSDKNVAAAIKLTTQYYVLPPLPGEKHGRYVHKKAGATDWGVNPDILVKMAPQQIEKSVELRQQADIIEEWKDEADRKPRPDPRDLLAKNLDPQLETALLILQARVLKDLEREALAAAPTPAR